MFEMASKKRQFARTFQIADLAVYQKSESE